MILQYTVYRDSKFASGFHNDIWYLLPSAISPFRISEGAAFSTQVRVGIFRGKVNINKSKGKN